MAQALPLILMGINETLKSQGITSEEQSAGLDPYGFILENMVINPLVNNAIAKQEDEDYKKMGEANKAIETRGINQWVERGAKAEADRVAEKKKREEQALIRTPAQSRHFNKAYQTSITQAIANPISQKPIQPKIITRTTGQQVAEKELQQKIKTLKAQLQPAVVTPILKRPLPPSIPLKGKGVTKLLARVMNEFNMSKDEATKYIQKHGSN